MGKPWLHILQHQKFLDQVTLIESNALSENFIVTKDHVISGQPDLIYVQNYASPPIYKQLKFYPRQYVAHMGGDVWNELNGLGDVQRLAQVTDTLNRAKLVVANSYFLAEIIHNHVRQAPTYPLPGGLWGTCCAPKGVNPYMFTPKQSYAIVGRPKALLNISLKIRRKYEGLTHFLEIVSKVQRNWDLVLHCAGKVKPNLARYLQNKYNITFLGYRDDWHSLLPSYDLFIHPSNFDCFPRAVAEAMCAGLPVLAFDVAGTPEVGDLAVLVNPTKPDEVRHYLSLLLRNTELRRFLGTQSRLYAVEKTEKYRHHYIKVLDYALNNL